MQSKLVALYTPVRHPCDRGAIYKPVHTTSARPRSQLRSYWHRLFLLFLRDGAFEDEQRGGRDQGANHNGEQVLWQVGDHIWDGQDEDAAMRNAQLTPEEHRDASRHRRAYDTGWNNAERIFCGVGNSSFGNKGQSEHPH